jgi:transcriptional regulator with XRE-family HTH domain
MARTTTDLDALIGARVKLRRKELGMSQSVLGAKLGITFQQIQKYENGTNRISAGCLYEISRALSVPITYFFQDCKAAAQRSPAHERVQP